MSRLHGLRQPPAVLAVRGAALALALAGFGHTLWEGVAEPGHALAFCLLIAVGEPAPGARSRVNGSPRPSGPPGRSGTPSSDAAAGNPPRTASSR